MKKKNDFYKEMAALVREWEKKYGQKIKTFDPTEVSAFRLCKVCGSDKNIQRHHKANDFMFARLLPDRYAARYIEYNRQDCDPLCSDCHQNYHIWIDVIVRQFWYWHNYHIVNIDGTFTYELAEHWKAIFLVTYNTWLTKQKEICIKVPSQKSKKTTLNKPLK